MTPIKVSIIKLNQIEYFMTVFINSQTSKNWYIEAMHNQWHTFSEVNFENLSYSNSVLKHFYMSELFKNYCYFKS